MSDKSQENTWLITGSLMFLSVFAAGVVLLYTRVVMVPFVLAIFVFMLVSPVLDFQVMRLKFPRTIAVVLTLAVVMVFVAVICFLIAGAIQMIVDTIGRYSNSFANLAEQIFSKMDNWGIELDQGKIVDDLRNKVPELVTSTFSKVFSFLSSVLLVIIFAAFLLAGRNPYAVKSGVYADIDLNIRRYVAIKVVVSAVTGVLVWITLALFGLELAAVFGIFAFLLNFIPSIGSIISTLLPIPIAVAQFQNPWLIVLVVAIPGTIQTFIGNVIEPKMMGEGLNLHPVTVLLALSFWGLVWGLTGMLLATPITAIIRIVLMQFETLRPIGKLLAGDLPHFSQDTAKQ